MMTEIVRRVSLDELTIVRVTCQRCKGVAEHPIENLHKIKQECPFCLEKLYRDQTPPSAAFIALHKAIDQLKQNSDTVLVYFPIIEKTQ